MANRYWVGGSGNWDASSTANWSASSGGASGASAPTSADNVIFDANSNVGTGAFTVTVTGTSVSPAACADFSTGGAGGALDGAMTLSLGATAQLDCYGSMTLPATNLTWSGTSGANLFFRSTTTGKTVTTNGVSIAATQVNFSGSGGGWTLGSALTITTANLVVLNGTFDTSASNYSISCNALVSTGSSAATINLNASAVTLSASGSVTFSNTNLTFNAGTSTITCSNASPTFAGNGVTFYNVTFSSTAAGTVTMTGANIFNNLTQSTIAAVGIKFFSLGAGITVNGTLTLNNGTLGGARVVFRSSSTSNIRTVTVATLATTADVDFYNIAAAGASIPWSGTRLGNCGGNSNITFVAGVNKYWNLAAGGNWNSTAWALTSGGAVAAINYPLPQDTAIIENTGLNTGATITMNVSAYIGSLDCSGRTNAFNWTQGNSDPLIFGSTFKLSSAMTMTTVTGSPTFNFSGRNITQTFDSAGIQVRLSSFTINVVGGTLLLAGNTTVDLTNGTGNVNLNLGTLDLAGYTLTAVSFGSSNSDTRSIAFGTGNITITGNNATVWGCSTLTNFSYTGTPTVNFTYSGSTGTRTIQNGSTGGTETNAVSMNVTAGSDTVTLQTTGVVKNFSSAGFTGLSNLFGFHYGNLTLGSGSTQSPSSTATATFAATSGTQTITSNGVTIDRFVTIDAPGAIVQCQDALTLGSTRTLTMTNGTLQLKAGVTSTVGIFATSGTNQKYLQSTLAGTQATLSDASGTVSVSYLTIQDINATGGATWVSLILNSNINNGNNSGWTFYYNTYNSSIGEFVNGADDCATNIIGYSFVSESANANDLFVSRYLWTIIDNGETANWQTVIIDNGETTNWQTITNSTSVWTDVNNP